MRTFRQSIEHKWRAARNLTEALITIGRSISEKQHSTTALTLVSVSASGFSPLVRRDDAIPTITPPQDFQSETTEEQQQSTQLSTWQPSSYEAGLSTRHVSIVRTRATNGGGGEAAKRTTDSEWIASYVVGRQYERSTEEQASPPPTHPRTLKRQASELTGWLVDELSSLGRRVDEAKEKLREKFPAKLSSDYRVSASSFLGTIFLGEGGSSQFSGGNGIFHIL